MNWDYLAGFIDGEGCFSAFHPQNTRLHLSITNTDRGVLEDISKFISNETNVSIPLNIRISNTAGRKVCYRLYLGPPALRIILPIIKDKLIVRKFQAEVMLEILSIVRERKTWLKEIRAVGSLHNRRSKEDVRILEILIDKLRWANKGYK